MTKRKHDLKHLQLPRLKPVLAKKKSAGSRGKKEHQLKLNTVNSDKSELLLETQCLLLIPFIQTALPCERVTDVCTGMRTRQTS